MEKNAVKKKAAFFQCRFAEHAGNARQRVIKYFVAIPKNEKE